VSQTERTLTQCALNNDDLQRLTKTAAVEAQVVDTRRIFAAERAGAISQMLSISQDPKRTLEAMNSGGISEGEPSDVQKALVYGLQPFLKGWWKDQASIYIDHMNGLIKSVTAAPREALKQAAEAERKADDALERRRPRAILTALLAPSVSAATVKHVAQYQSLLLMQTALAVEMYRNDKGQLPESLDGLVPQYLPAVPEDFSSEGKIRYAKDTKGYRLWSVGRDGKDNGGVVLMEGSWPKVEGSDLVFRVLR